MLKKETEGNYAVYGNIPWKSEIQANVNVNDAYETAYACWLSPSVFYIPVNAEERKAKLELSSETSYNLKYGEEQFYALNLEKLMEVTKKLSKQAADTITIENGYANITKTVTEKQNLFISIPYDASWSITRNGEKIEPELFAECMYSIPLQEGINTIEMTYHVPFLKVGVFVSLAGLCLLVITWYLERKYLNKFI